MNFKNIKNRAKQIVKGNLWDYWKGYIIYTVVTAIILWLISLIGGKVFPTDCYYNMVIDGENICAFGGNDIASNISSLLTSLILAPLSFGFVYYTMRYTRGQSLDPNDIFKYKKQWIPTFLLMFLTSLFIGLWSLLFIIPGIIASYRYAMVNYIWCDQQLDALDCIKKSKKMMKGYKWNYFLFDLSFIGWEFLGILTFGLLYIWLTPYMSTAKVLYYEELKKLEN